MNDFVCFILCGSRKIVLYRLLHNHAPETDVLIVAGDGGQNSFFPMSAEELDVLKAFEIGYGSGTHIVRFFIVRLFSGHQESRREPSFRLAIELVFYLSLTGDLKTIDPSV